MNLQSSNGQEEKNISFSTTSLDQETPKEGSTLGESFYLNYGESGLNPTLDLDSLSDLFTQILPKRNILTEARHRETFDLPANEAYYTKQCDFCGMPMTEVDMEVMGDGRIRCSQCRQDQVESQEEFESIYYTCKQNFESIFEIKLPKGIHAFLTYDEEDIEATLTPLCSFENENSSLARMGRVYKEKSHYDIYLESGISRLACMFILICSFSLIWQDKYLSLSKIEEQIQKLSDTYGKELFQGWQVGMALWSGTEYLFLIQEKSYALKNDRLNEREERFIAQSYLYFRQKYPFQSYPEQLKKHYPLREKIISKDIQEMKRFIFQELQLEESVQEEKRSRGWLRKGKQKKE